MNVKNSLYKMNRKSYINICDGIMWDLQITSSDKDFRYMATSDLARELESPDLVLDEYNSKRVIDAVLNQIYDSSGDISGLANKW